MTTLKITRLQFERTHNCYYSLVRQMPKELAVVMPSFELFLSPLSLSGFNPWNDTEELTVTGTKRWHALLSPHAKAILCAYAVQRLGNDNGS